MSHIARDITALIGRTPLLDLGRYTKKRDIPAVLLAKLEYLNPAGSVKAVSYTHLDVYKRQARLIPARNASKSLAGLILCSRLPCLA